MSVNITEITTKSALVRSKIPGAEFVINPYLGCSHGCRYCYAEFMRRYSRHHRYSPWGSFVEVKVNLPEVLRAEVRRRPKPGRVLLASVCDPYQPVEKKYRLTRQCLEILLEHGWQVSLLTRSPLVVRDLDLLKSAPGVRVGFSITTDQERVRRVLEPKAPLLAARLMALRQLYEAGLYTWVFVAPILPLDPVRLVRSVAPFIHDLKADPLNYREKVRGIFGQEGWEYALTDEYFLRTEAALFQEWRRLEPQRGPTAVVSWPLQPHSFRNPTLFS